MLHMTIIWGTVKYICPNPRVIKSDSELMGKEGTLVVKVPQGF